MQKINYQGREIKVERTNHISGAITTKGEDLNGDEELFCDEEGRYYLRRKLDVLDAQGERQHASKRTHVHRISAKAAILWATTRLNSETLDLRCTAADLLRLHERHSDVLAVLDDHSRELRRRELASEPGSDPRDVLNGAVGFLLADPEDDDEACSAAVCVERATARRTDRQSIAARATPPPVPVVEANGEQQDDGCHRFTFDYPATPKTCGMRRTIELDDAQMARASELAATFDLTASQFLYGLADNNHLPGQSRRANNLLRGLLKAEHLAFVCLDGTMAKRIERAAQACGQTADELVADALSGDVDMYEENMLLHPTTGELLEADFETLFTETENKMLVPPLGLEHAPEFQTHPGRQRVRFDAWLTSEELSQMQAIRVVRDPSRLRFLQLAIPAESEPRLTVDGKEALLPDMPPGVNGEHQPPDGRQQAGGMTAHLDPEAAALVRRYLEVTPWNVTAEDIASGCVCHALEIAFDNLEEAEEQSGLASDETHDGEWGYMQESIEAATERRTGERADLKDPDDERTVGSRMVRLEVTVSDLSGEELDRRDREEHRRQQGTRPEDTALLAAAAPEPVEAAPPAENEETLPEEEHTDDEDDDNAGEEWKEGR